MVLRIILIIFPKYFIQKYIILLCIYFLKFFPKKHHLLFPELFFSSIDRLIEEKIQLISIISLPPTVFETDKFGSHHHFQTVLYPQLNKNYLKFFSGMVVFYFNLSSYSTDSSYNKLHEDFIFCLVFWTASSSFLFSFS